jgi:hypothetical protein
MASFTIPIELELSQRSRDLLEALSKSLPARVVAAPPEAGEAAQPQATAYQIGQHYAAIGGVYAGITRADDGKPAAHLFLLDAQPSGKLDWDDGNRWAQGLGHEAHMPRKAESALLYANVPEHLDATEWHWIGEQYSGYDAWMQYFDYGGQHGDRGKEFERRCRAVRRFPL